MQHLLWVTTAARRRLVSPARTRQRSGGLIHVRSRAASVTATDADYRAGAASRGRGTILYASTAGRYHRAGAADLYASESGGRTGRRRPARGPTPSQGGGGIEYDRRAARPVQPVPAYAVLVDRAGRPTLLGLGPVVQASVVDVPIPAGGGGTGTEGLLPQSVLLPPVLRVRFQGDHLMPLLVLVAYTRVRPGRRYIQWPHAVSVGRGWYRARSTSRPRPLQ